MADTINGVEVARKPRGFATMDKAKVVEIAKRGGVAAHVKGTAHEWTSEQASAAGRKGGLATAAAKAAKVAPE